MARGGCSISHPLLSLKTVLPVMVPISDTVISRSATERPPLPNSRNLKPQALREQNGKGWRTRYVSTVDETHSPLSKFSTGYWR